MHSYDVYAHLIQTITDWPIITLSDWHGTECIYSSYSTVGVWLSVLAIYTQLHATDLND